MARFRDGLYLTCSLLLLAAVIAILSRALQLDRSCLEWQGLAWIDSGAEKAPVCSSLNRLQKAPSSERVRNWVSRLNQLRRLNWLSTPKVPVQISIDQQDPMAYEVTPGHVRLGVAVAAREGHLERAAVAGWVRTNWPALSLPNQTVVTDLLTWAALGDQAWSDGVTGESADPKMLLRYMALPLSSESYCAWAFRDDQDLNACAAHTLKWTEEMTTSHLVSHILWTTLSELPASSQIAWWSWLTKGTLNPPILPLELPRTDLIANSVRAWFQAADIAAGREMHSAMLQAQMTERPSYDMTLEIPEGDLRIRAMASLKKWLTYVKRKHILIVFGKQKILLPENVRVDTPVEEIQSNRHVLLACEWPKLKDVSPLKASLFYAFKVCGQDPLPAWHDLLTAPPQPLSQASAKGS